jgi:hypothetical protein
VTRHNCFSRTYLTHFLLIFIETWFIYTNGFSGELPAEIGDLQNLQQFRAHENFFEGELPGSLFDLTSLGVLRLDVNSFTGRISPSIGELTKLRTLRLELNFFTGAIPQEIGQLTELGKCSRRIRYEFDKSEVRTNANVLACFVQNSFC